MKTRSVLVVEADSPTRRRLDGILRDLGYDAVFASSVDEALVALGRDSFAFSLLDANLDGSDGLNSLPQLRAHRGQSGPVILIADEHDVGRAREATSLGAADFIPKSFRPTDLENVVKEVRARPPAGRDGTAGPEPGPGDDDARSRLRREVGLWKSAKMRELAQIVEQAARVDVTILIGGETGTGKDLVARAIHQFSSRQAAAFVKVNCAAVARELLESELFGHERGAFTGAHQLKIGMFESADHGTIFLDEIGDLHAALQAKLLHVLQDRTFSRVGGKSTIKVDVRVLAATNRDLERAVAEGRFREDLFYRLNVVQIVVPPLRDRMEEVPPLARYFAERYARLFRREGFTLSPVAMDRLMRHRYPGNIRELENIIKRMIVLDDPHLARIPFPPGSANGPSKGGDHDAPRTSVPALAVPLKDVARAAARAAEREAIARVLQQTGWNRVRAAKLLQISYRALLYKIKDTGLNRAVEPAS
jgi:two-component system response regulator AtoC